MSEEKVLPQKFAALFVDVPNIEHWCTQEGDNHQFSFGEIKWDVLVERMLSSLGADDYTYVGNVYLFAGNGRKHTIDWLAHGMKRGLGRYRREVKVHVRSGKDIDVMMVNDVWECFVGMLHEQERQGIEPPLEVTILIAGGDGAYSYPIKSLRALVPDMVNLRLHTFTWSGNLAYELSQLSDYVELLDKTGPSITPEQIVLG